MADYTLQELTIDLKQEIGNVELTIIIDDIYLPVVSYDVNGQHLTLFLTELLDYHLIVNNEVYMMLSVTSRDIIDEQDMDISADVDYQFEKGILVFNY